MQAPTDFETESLDTFLELETMDPVSSITSSWIQQAAIRSALRVGNEPLAVRFAISSGVRDENRLTDLVFYTRYPQQWGKQLARGDPLGQKWLEIRDRLVKPLVSTASAPAAQPTPPANGAALSELRTLSTSSTTPTVANALRIMKLVCTHHAIPWRIGYVIMNHEGGVSKFTHADGVMQTIASARKTVLPLIPRPLKLALLGKPSQDQTPDTELTSALHREFSRRLAVQIAAGVQELKQGLDAFNGHVALALQAYNAGSWAYYTVTQDSKRRYRPAGIAAEKWETLCREGATLLHRPVSEIRVDTGTWQCDVNMPGWSSHIPVFDKKTNRQLIAFKYLRSITECIHGRNPSLPCNKANRANHGKRDPGTGEIRCRQTRPGALDKLYDAGKLDSAYYHAAKNELPPIPDDGKPLKVINGQLVKVEPAAI